MTQRLGGRWWLILAVYLAVGFALGLIDPLLRQVPAQLGFDKAGLATAASVNVFLPLLAIGLGVVCPRLASAIFGGIGMAVAHSLGLAVNYFPGPQWDPITLLRAV